MTALNKTMITNFKIFENICVQPKVGDYVMIKPEIYKDAFENVELLYKFFDNQIGQIKKILKNHNNKKIEYVVDFENVPDELNFEPSDDFLFILDDFKCWSDNKEKLEIMINAKKYNV